MTPPLTLAQATQDLIIDARRLCDRQLGGTYEDDCRKSIREAEAALLALDTSAGETPQGTRKPCACGQDDYDSSKWDACYNCRNKPLWAESAPPETPTIRPAQDTNIFEKKWRQYLLDRITKAATEDLMRDVRGMLTQAVNWAREDAEKQYDTMREALCAKFNAELKVASAPQTVSTEATDKMKLDQMSLPRLLAALKYEATRLHGLTAEDGGKSPRQSWKELNRVATMLAAAYDALSTASAPPQGWQGWQPIATAPTEGEHFLAVVDGMVRRVAFGKTSHISMFGWCLADQGAENFDLCEPTHWMPLPAPPSAPTGEKP